MTPPADRRRARGMTLVELLVAIVIAVLLIAVVFTTYRTVTAVRFGQQQRALETHAAAAALDQVQQGLMRIFLPADDPACALTATQELARTDISFCFMAPSPEEADVRWARTARARYRVLDDQLLYSEQPLTGPGSQGGAATNVLAGGVERFVVRLFDGTTWQDRWPPAASKAKPRAARIEISTSDQRVWTTEIWIPAGTVFTSSLQRAGIRGP